MKAILSLCLTLITLTASGQYTQQRNGIVFYNMAFSAVIGGIGSAINKRPAERRTEAFGRGFYRGAIGGTVAFCGKNLTRRIVTEQALGYGWAAKLVHSTGVSITENAAAGRGFLDQFALDAGPLRVDLNTGRRQPGDSPVSARRVCVRIAPVALAGFVYSFTQGKLNLGATLQSGSPIFVAPGMEAMGMNGVVGVSSVNSIQLRVFNYQTIAHEMIHGFQYRDYTSLNGLLVKTDARLRQKSTNAQGSGRSVYGKLSRWIYLDTPFFGLAFLQQHLPYLRGGAYNDNYFERETRNLTQAEFIP